MAEFPFNAISSNVMFPSPTWSSPLKRNNTSIYVQDTSSKRSKTNVINSLSNSVVSTMAFKKRKFKKAFKKYKKAYKKKKSYLRKSLKPEIKYSEGCTNTQFTIATGASIGQGVCEGQYHNIFRNITVGTAVSERIGNKVQLVGLKVAALIHHPRNVSAGVETPAANSNGIFKLNLSRLLTPGSDITTWTNTTLYAAVTNGMAIPVPSLQDYRRNQSIAKVIHTEKRMLDGFAGENEHIEFFWKPKKPLTVTWSTAGTNFTTIQKNPLFLEVQFGSNKANQAAATAVYPYYDLYWTAFFIDC